MVPSSVLTKTIELVRHTSKKGFDAQRVNVESSAGGFVVALDAPKGRYDPGRRNLTFVIKGTGRTYQPASITDDGSARALRIN